MVENGDDIYCIIHGRIVCLIVSSMLPWDYANATLVLQWSDEGIYFSRAAINFYARGGACINFLQKSIYNGVMNAKSCTRSRLRCVCVYKLNFPFDSNRVLLRTIMSTVRKLKCYMYLLLTCSCK